MHESRIATYTHRRLPAATIAGVLLLSGCSAESSERPSAEAQQQAASLERIIQPAAEHIAALAIRGTATDKAPWSQATYPYEDQVQLRADCVLSSGSVDVAVSLAGNNRTALRPSNVEGVELTVLDPESTSVSVVLSAPHVSPIEAEDARWSALETISKPNATSPVTWETEPGHLAPHTTLQVTAQQIVNTAELVADEVIPGCS